MARRAREGVADRAVRVDRGVRGAGIDRTPLTYYAMAVIEVDPDR